MLVTHAVMKNSANPQLLRENHFKHLLKQLATSVHPAVVLLLANRSYMKVKSKTNSCSQFSLFHVDQKVMLTHPLNLAAKQQRKSLMC